MSYAVALMDTNFYFPLNQKSKAPAPKCIRLFIKNSYPDYWPQFVSCSFLQIM